jgi:DNA-directed RNA polymerase specialized sigma24 family protein
MAKANLKRDWQPDKAAFDRLLAWLDEGSESGGERYLEMRRRLVEYFARRDCHSPEDLADETLNRVARRLDETGVIDDGVPARYCYIVAKFVFLESLRRPRQVDLVDHGGQAVAAPVADERAESERTFGCLEQCLQSCSPIDRALILDYYRAPGGSARQQRKHLAQRLGITANSLAIRACRIRSRLEECVRSCVAAATYRRDSVSSD